MDKEDNQKIELANGDILHIHHYNFYLSARTPDTEDATQFCSGHWIQKKGESEAESFEMGSGVCTRVGLESGDLHRAFWRNTGERKWEWHTTGGTGRYKDVKCEGTGFVKLNGPEIMVGPPWRFTNILTGTCTE